MDVNDSIYFVLLYVIRIGSWHIGFFIVLLVVILMCRETNKWLEIKHTSISHVIFINLFIIHNAQKPNLESDKSNTNASPLFSERQLLVAALVSSYVFSLLLVR